MSLIQNAKAGAFALAQVFRSTQYLVQSFAGSALLGRAPTDEQKQELPPVQAILKSLLELHAKDAASMASGEYLMPERWTENPLEFAKISTKAFLDAWSVRKRESNGDVQDVPDEGYLSKLPKYYRQNFHFQTDGWLSDHSAQLYEHQVEVVFAGGAGAMRRRALPMIKSHIQNHSLEQPDLKFLDLASGPGSFATEIKRNFKESHLTVSDLSPFYLKKAREKLSGYAGVDFVEAKAEQLPFLDASFDVVSSVYLFHELPKRVRTEVMKEVWRVLRPGGLFVFVDSLQLGDVPHFDGSLKYFPVHYHEPYYLDYIKQPLSEYILPTQFAEKDEEFAFFSKVKSYVKLV